MAHLGLDEGRALLELGESERSMFRVWGSGFTLPQTNMEPHIALIWRGCSLYRAPFGFPC